MEVPVDNPTTNEGVELGRHLFYDPILSLDSTISCASCHKQENAFAADVAFSLGVDGTVGFRNSMSLANLAFVPPSKGLNWDGLVPTLEEHHLEPVVNELEMKEDWNNVENKLRQHPTYPQMFRRAFGIENSGEITRDHTVKALAQFIRTLISLKSKYDWRNGFVDPNNKPLYTTAEDNGATLVTTEGPIPDTGPECVHCHQPNRFFTDHTFRNNGLDSDFTDLGKGAVTGIPGDNGKFKTTTLRNIALTAPYMHDGRFATLEEVMDHYSEGLHPSPTIDPILGVRIPGIGLTEQEKSDIISFLHALTDTSFVTNPAFSSPF